MRPLRRASRPHHLVRGLGGVVRRGVPWCRAGALSHTFPVADGRRSGASTGRHPLVRRRGLRLWHHARIRLRDGQGGGGASARSQRAQSLNRARLWTGRGAGSHAWAAPCDSVLSSCSLCDAVARRVGVVKQRMRVAARAGAGWEGRCACRGVAGDVPGLWRGRRHARIRQRRRVGELEPELYFLGVSGQFHELVKRRKNRLRASRAPSRGAPGRAHPVGNARRAHRCLAGLARRAGRGRAQCT